MQIAPNSILGKSHGHTAPSDKLNIAVVGIGGMGITNIQHVFETENIVALCDVDWKYAKPVLDCFPRAGKYKDFRRMFDEMDRDIDYRCYRYDIGQTCVCPETVGTFDL